MLVWNAEGRESSRVHAGGDGSRYGRDRSRHQGGGRLRIPPEYCRSCAEMQWLGMLSLAIVIRARAIARLSAATASHWNLALRSAQGINIATAERTLQPRRGPLGGYIRSFPDVYRERSCWRNISRNLHTDAPTQNGAGSGGAGSGQHRPGQALGRAGT